MSDHEAVPEVPEPDVQTALSSVDDDLVPTNTTGYKPAAQKTVNELLELDQNDESLKKWKETLLKNVTKGSDHDQRRVVVLGLSLEVEGRPDITLDFSTPEIIQSLKKNPFVVKEGSEYRLKVKFRVQHEVVAGLKYLHVVKRAGIRVDKMEEMIGSYAPQDAPYEKKFMPEQAPSGILTRGQYNVKSKFIDDDKTVHLEWEWALQIKKDWSD